MPGGEGVPPGDIRRWIPDCVEAVKRDAASDCIRFFRAQPLLFPDSSTALLRLSMNTLVTQTASSPRLQQGLSTQSSQHIRSCEVRTLSPEREYSYEDEGRVGDCAHHAGQAVLGHRNDVGFERGKGKGAATEFVEYTGRRQ